MPRPPARGPPPVPLCPKVPRGSANSLPSSRRRTPVRVLGLTGHSLSIIPGLLNPMASGGRVATLLNSPGTGLPSIKAALTQHHQTPLSTNGCRTSGHRSTMTLMSNRIIIMALTHDVCLSVYQVLASDRHHTLLTSRATLLHPSSICNTKRRRGYHWISTHFLLVGRSTDCRSRAMIS